VCQAAIALIDDKDLQTKDLLKFIKGPDFPTGGQITNSKRSCARSTRPGRGPSGCAASGRPRRPRRAQQIVVTSIPFNVTKSTLVERIAEVIIAKKLPMLTDVRDESTDEVRIVLELKSGADPALVMAYLYKHTPMELSFHVNMTCLVPTQNREVAGPMRWTSSHPQRVPRLPRGGGHPALRVRAGRAAAAHPHPGGLRHRLRCARRGIRIIRKSGGQGRRGPEADQALRAVEEQTDAILELKLYKLARLEIQIILEELKAKKPRPRRSRRSSRTSASCGGSSATSWRRSARSSPTSAAPRSAAPAARTWSSTPRPSSSTRR
jgi:DNA gyrase subunit A